MHPRGLTRELWLPALVLAAGLGVLVFSLAVLPLRLALVSCALGWAMLAIAVVDARRFIIPDMLSLPAIPAGLLASGRLLDPAAAEVADIDHVIGMIAGGASLWLVRALYYRVRGQEGLGLGDVKLAAAGGAWIGWQHLADMILIAAVAALALAVLAAAGRRQELSGASKIPFGSFLAPSIWLVWVLLVSGGTR
jgi:leader peptidase (prepilin peptidase)/N-methyltransferase